MRGQRDRPVPANSIPRRAEQILVIENGRGIGPDDHGLMRKRLEEQGVQEIASVSLHEQ